MLVPVGSLSSCGDLESSTSHDQRKTPAPQNGAMRPCSGNRLVVKKTSDLLYPFILPSPRPPWSRPCSTHARNFATPPTVHFKWMVDLVTMPMGMGQMRYLVLAREDMTNQEEGRALQNKMMTVVCRFLIKEVICRYRCREAEELFGRLGVETLSHHGL